MGKYILFVPEGTCQLVKEIVELGPVIVGHCELAVLFREDMLLYISGD